MTTCTQPPIRLGSPSDLIAAIPYLLGFHPKRSVVVVTHGAPKGREVGCTMRIDLPPPELEKAAVGRLVDSVIPQRCTAVTVVIIGSERGADHAEASVSANSQRANDSIPHRRVVRLLSAAFEAAGIPVWHSLWTAATAAGVEWFCYTDGSCRGTVADPDSSVIAAVSAMAGVVTYGSREELAQLLECDDPEALPRRAAMLDRAVEEAADGREMDRGRGVDLVQDAIAAHDDGRALDDESVVSLAIALGDHRVRDAFLLPDDPAAADACSRLWLALTRETPTPERADPACLLACSAYLRGDGALASLALEAAAAADPGHVLTELLQRSLHAGITPTTLHELLRRAIIGTDREER